MKYRKFGKLGFEVSNIGLGCMRLPVKKNEAGKTIIDEDHAINMIRYAVDKGVSYIDTAYIYHDGESEALLGKALQNGYRKKVNLVTKLPCWLVKSYDDFDKFLNEQLDKLKTDYLDFYLLHALDKNSWEKMKELGVVEFLDNAKKQGKIKHAGFSFHDQISTFKEILDSYDWDMCQIQLNLLDEDYQAGIEGLKYAASKNIGVVIMEPLRGGALAQRIPDDIKAVYDKSEIKRPPVEWALRWLGNLPEVTVVLSGSSSLEQITQNIEIFDIITPSSLTESELGILDEVKKLYKVKIKIGCTRCKYCMPCPVGVEISEIFRTYNSAHMFNNLDKLSDAYNKFVTAKKHAGLCVECGKCEALCPQGIQIIDNLKFVHAECTEK